MREILFRGKRLDNGKWVYGSPLYDFADCSLKKDGKCACLHDGKLIDFLGWNDDFHEYDSTEVDPATVGQYTGLRDKNGKRIFEGDIVRRDFGREEIGVQFAVVQYSDRYNPGFVLCPLDDWMYTGWRECEVIGNIYDDLEL